MSCQLARNFTDGILDARTKLGQKAEAIDHIGVYKKDDLVCRSYYVRIAFHYPELGIERCDDIVELSDQDILGAGKISAVIQGFVSGKLSATMRKNSSKQQLLAKLLES
jgi:hypothetical protein